MADIDAIRARLAAYDDAQARPCGLRVHRVLAFGDETPDGHEVRYDAGPCRRVAGHEGPCSESLVRPLFGAGAIRVLLAEVDVLRQRLDVATAATEPALLNAIAALVDAADRAPSRSEAMRAAQLEKHAAAAAARAATMRGLPNDIAKAEGYADGLADALAIAMSGDHLEDPNGR